MGAYRVTLDLLGRRTADLHRTLHAVEGEGFGAHPLTKADLERLAREMTKQSQRVLDLLAAQSSLPQHVQPKAQRLLALRPRLAERFARVAALDDAGMCSRIHGDLHLGQVLEADGDLFFIDFEGEPARPLAERRALQSPLRDIAGMLRSFGYAARAGLRICLRHKPDAVLEPWVRAWEAEASRIFVAAYLKQVGDSPALPNTAAQQVLLQAFVLDKAMYELAYELGNRPDWVDIPLDGLLGLLEPDASPSLPS
jgi:maltose alpha-D-glucosyltransferase / alpha-amylase